MTTDPPEEIPLIAPAASSQRPPGERLGHALDLLAAWDETPTLRGLRLRAPLTLAQSYRVPGQYLEVHHPQHGRGYFALAAAPADPEPGAHDGVLELLVRRGSALPNALAELPTGATELRASAVLGAGFPAELMTRDLLLVATGSGIAPLRAVLQQRARGGDLHRVALYFGERSEADLAYRPELERLAQSGLQLELVLSRPPASWQGPTGRVQTRLLASPPSWLGSQTVAFLCGQPTMIADTAAMLTTAGLPSSQIRVNY